MTKLRLITAALVAFSLTTPLGPAAYAEMLEKPACAALEAQKRILLTADVQAALAGGPDWVKEHLHKRDDIEQVRAYLRVEEKIAFRCRTDGVRMPKPKPPPLPDPKPAVPVIMAEGQKVLAGAAAISFLPLRKPAAEEAEGAPVGAQESAGDADTETEVTSAVATGGDAGSSQAVEDSDKTARSENKATR
jgi:hypothetical protein